MTAFILKPYMQRWYRAALSGRPESSAAQALKDETDGLALSFTDTFFRSSTGHYGSALVKDTSTPANNYDSHPFGLLTYAGASKKWVRGPSGLLIESDPALTLPYEWDENGDLLGIRVEEQRTNLILQSQAIATSPWGNAANHSATNNTDTAPDGTQTACTVSRTGTGIGGWRQSVSISTNTVYTGSFFIKKTSGATEFPTTSLEYNDVGTTEYGIVINTDTGDTFDASGWGNGGPTTTVVEDYGDFWRISMTVPGNATATALTFYLTCSVADGTDGTRASNTSGTGSNVVWGYQLEAGDKATSYIPTGTNAVTRNADVFGVDLIKFPHNNVLDLYVVDDVPTLPEFDETHLILKPLPGEKHIRSVLFLPLSLDDVEAVHDVSNLATVFADRDGDESETPASVDGPVGTVLDLSGKGNHYIATSDNARPTLRQSGNKYWLEFDDEAEEQFFSNSLSATVRTFGCAFRPNATVTSSSTTQVVYGLDSGLGLLGLGSFTGALAGEVIGGGAGDDIGERFGSAFPTSLVAEADLLYVYRDIGESARDARLRLNGADLPMLDPVGDARMTGIDALGATSDSEAFFGGNWYGDFVFSSLKSVKDTEKLEKWLQARVVGDIDPPQEFSGAWTQVISPRGIVVDGQVVVGVNTANGISGIVREDGIFIPFRSTGQDDHNGPALLQRASDGRILTCYTGHNLNVYYTRISEKPNDVLYWGEELELSGTFGNGANQFTYSNLVEIEDGIFNFLRCDTDSTDAYTAHYSLSTDGGETWSPVVQLLDGLRPYPIPVKSGSNRIDLCIINGNPNETAASVYHLYYEDGAWFDSAGNNLGAPPFDPAEDLTQVYDGSSQRAAVWGIAWDSDSNVPIIVYQKAVTPGVDGDIRYMYAKWNGSSWDSFEICEGGGALYAGEPHYSGGLCIDLDDPNIIYCCREDESGVYQLWKGVTSDGGQTWSLTQLTDEETDWCLRPYKVQGSNKVVFEKGTYTSYTNFDTVMVFLEV